MSCINFIKYNVELVARYSKFKVLIALRVERSKELFAASSR